MQPISFAKSYLLLFIVIVKILCIGFYLFAKKCRDLKPENILFEGREIESTVKVIDFGRSIILKPNQKLVEKAGSVNT